MISVYYGISTVKNLPNSLFIPVTKYLFPTESILSICVYALFDTEKYSLYSRKKLRGLCLLINVEGALRSMIAVNVPPKLKRIF